MKKLHLICNAHLDPVWLWEWEEGASAALSTFASAVNLAEKFDYIFCHNEVMLYKWIQEYAPPLFDKIKALVSAGKWHIMGGWYLQPDCNLPSGESFVRQIMEGRKYFEENFGVKPTTAINFDPFGHSRGLVQILKKCGYDSYMVCRPGRSELDMPDDFIWKGYDGSKVMATRVSSHYNSGLGHAANKIRAVIGASEKETDVVLWGVGNHGGGPSAKDLKDIEALMKESSVEIAHSTPESYFSERKGLAADVLESGINYCMPGCYSSMIQIKQLHRRLENELYMTEKMCAHAAMSGDFVYPHAELSEAQADLLCSEFHDVLPGSGIKEVEEYGVRVMNHGLEILNRLRAKAFFFLSKDERPAKPGEFPVIVYNPHPYPVRYVADVGFNLEDQNYEETFTDITVYEGTTRLPAQVIKERSNLTLDWMKRVKFECTLAPCSVNRFDCKKEVLPSKPVLPKIAGKSYRFDNGHMKAEIDAATGLLKELSVDGKRYLTGGAFSLDVYGDNADPWAMHPDQLVSLGKNLLGRFELMSGEKGSVFSGIEGSVIPSVRIVESGEVYEEVETVLSYGTSAARVNYLFYKSKNEIDVQIDLLFAEKNRLVKLHIPTALAGGSLAQVAFGREALDENGRERVMHKWARRDGDGRSVAVINDGVYGLSCLGSDIDVTLLRSPAYSGHPVRQRPITPQDRFTARIDQGERNYRFKLLFGACGQIEEEIERQSQTFNERPFALAMFPQGSGQTIRKSAAELSNPKIIFSALKCACDGSIIVRLFNNHNGEEQTALRVGDAAAETRLGAFEVKTFKVAGGKITECESMEI